MPVTKHSATSPAVHIQKLSQPFVTKRDLSLEIQAKGIEQKVDATIDRLYHQVHIATVQFTMPTSGNTEEPMVAGTARDSIYIPSLKGTRCAWGCTPTEGETVEAHTCPTFSVMPGEFDNHLKWPFQGRITVQLLNQLRQWSP